MSTPYGSGTSTPHSSSSGSVTPLTSNRGSPTAFGRIVEGTTRTHSLQHIITSPQYTAETLPIITSLHQPPRPTPSPHHESTLVITLSPQRLSTTSTTRRRRLAVMGQSKLQHEDKGPKAGPIDIVTHLPPRVDPPFPPHPPLRLPASATANTTTADRLHLLYRPSLLLPQLPLLLLLLLVWEQD